MKRSRLTLAAVAVVLAGALVVAGVGHHRLEVSASTPAHDAQVTQQPTTTASHSYEHDDESSRRTTTTTASASSGGGGTTQPTPTTSSGAS